MSIPKVRESSFAKMLEAAQVKSGLTQRQLAKKMGWSQQTYNTWLNYVEPRNDKREKICEFLEISDEQLEALLVAQRYAVGSSKIPKLRVLDSDNSFGDLSDAKNGEFTFGPMFRPTERYKVLIETSVMEPALLSGTSVWTDPPRWPEVGNEVFAIRRDGLGFIGRLVSIGNRTVELEHLNPKRKIVVDNISQIHVIVLAERISV